MRRALVSVLVAAVAGLGVSTAAQAVTVSGDGFAIGSFSGQDCPLPSNGGSNNCWATQSGIVGSAPANDPTASRVVASIPSSGNDTINTASYPTVDGSEFNVQISGTTLSFTYTMGTGDPVLHYLDIKQADGYELFYDSAGFTSGTTYTFDLSKYFGVNDTGFSHVTVYDSTGAVPEPATWAMMLLGFGGVGMAMRRSKRRTSTLMQVA